MISKELALRNGSGIVAVADRGAGIHTSGNSADIRCIVICRALHCTVVGTVFDGAVAGAACNAAQISDKTGYISGHRYVSDHCIFYSAEQAQTDLLINAPRGHRHIHPADRMSLPVKRTGIVQSRVFVEMIRICDRRPRFHRCLAFAGGIIPVLVKRAVVEHNVVFQNGARGGVLRLAVRAVDDVAEPLQSIGGGDAVGIGRCAAAGCEGGRAGDLTVERAAGDGAAVGHLTVECAAGDGAFVGHLAFKRAAADGAAACVEHVPLEFGAGGAAAGDLRVFSRNIHRAVHRAAIGVHDAAQIQGISISESCLAVPDDAGRECKCTGLAAVSAIIDEYAAAEICRAAHDAAAVQRKGTARVTFIRFMHTHAAASGCRAADDIAAGHGELAAPHTHTAAISVAPVFHSRAAGDDAAGHGLRAVCLIQHPQASVVGREFMYSLGIAVLQRQIADIRIVFTAFYQKYAAAAGHFQYITVQIQRDGAPDRQGRADVDVGRQLDLRQRAVCQCGGQFRLCCDRRRCRSVFGKDRGRKQRQQHAADKQDAEQSFFHGRSSLSFTRSVSRKARAGRRGLRGDKIPAQGSTPLQCIAIVFPAAFFVVRMPYVKSVYHTRPADATGNARFRPLFFRRPARVDKRGGIRYNQRYPLRYGGMIT